jgi:heat shock protein HtpX
MDGLSRLKLSMATAAMLLFLVFCFFLAIPLYIVPFLLGIGFLIHPLYIVAFILILFLIQFLTGPWIVKRSTKLRYLQPAENPWLENIVKKLSDRSDISMPRLAIVTDDAPNAFVFGRTKKGATLVFNEGLLTNLSGEEIEGVIGHELGHLKHNDCAVMTTLAAIPILIYAIFMMLVNAAFSPSSSSSSKDSSIIGNIIGQIIGRILILIAALFPLLFYALSLLSLRSLSREREHYADAYSAYLTQSPRKLQSALTKITYGLSLSPKPKSDFGIRTFYIGDPAAAKKEFEGITERKEKYDLDRDGVLDERELELAMDEEEKQLEGGGRTFNYLQRGWRKINLSFSTHPRTYERILLLKEIENEMASGDYTDKRVYKHI